MDDGSLHRFIGGALAGSILAVPICLFLQWAFGGLARWWWLWPAAAVIACAILCVVATLLDKGEVPQPPPRKSKSPPKKPRKPRRAKGKVIDFAAERARRAGVKANG